ncbi:hypothetical protein GGS21DRAFT_250689 [Xylaria nigripes]|nr:hypothetical protein GGS21DRAFT_250689 [Xylaria nigripes]
MYLEYGLEIGYDVRGIDYCDRLVTFSGALKYPDRFDPICEVLMTSYFKSTYVHSTCNKFLALFSFSINSLFFFLSLNIIISLLYSITSINYILLLYLSSFTARLVMLCASSGFSRWRQLIEGDCQLSV